MYSYKSFIDFGSGRGAWAKAFEELGYDDYYLIDHPALDTESVLVKRKDRVIKCDIDIELPKLIRADLVLCIEVLEHFDMKRAKPIIDYLTSCSDLILFSAAVPGQGGKGHLNEQPHGFWHKCFYANGFDYFDEFKVKILDCVDQSNFYHAQNIFVYYHKERRNEFSRFGKLFNESFEIRHASMLNKKPGIVNLLRQFPAAFRNSASYHYQKIFGKRG